MAVELTGEEKEGDWDWQQCGSKRCTRRRNSCIRFSESSGKSGNDGDNEGGAERHVRVVAREHG